MMTLIRPLVVIDTETTGVEPEIDRIVQIGAVKVWPDGTETPHSWLVNPGISIPPEATEIHGITDAMVSSEPSFRERWPDVKILLDGSDFCAYNARFDLGMLAAECKRNGIAWTPPELVIDPLVIFRKRVPHSLEGAVSYYLSDDIVDAHDALADCRSTLAVLVAQTVDVGGSVADLVIASTPPKDDRFVDTERKFYWRFNAPVFAFGKHRGMPLLAVAKQDRGYLDWMARQDYGEEVRALISDAMRGKVPARATAAPAPVPRTVPPTPEEPFDPDSPNGSVLF